VLLGITFSPVAELRAWREELGLGCDLLCDADRQVAMAWGAASSPTQEKANRVSVLIGPDGAVVKSYPSPDPATHAAQVLDDL
jgi:peroxiredoxin Q/BCP